MKRNKTLWTIFLISAFCIASAMATEQPNSPPVAPLDPFGQDVLLSAFGDTSLPALDLSAYPLSVMGTQCSNVYATTGDYCSGNIRIYYQCLQTMDGSEWQQRSENCEDYPGKGRCSEADGQARCVDFAGSTSSTRAMIIIGIVLIIGGILLGFLVHPVFFIASLVGGYMMFKTISGGI